MKKILPVIFALACLAGKSKGPTTGWQLETHPGNKWTFTEHSATGYNTDISTFALDQSICDTFLAKNQSVDLRGKTISFSGYFNTAGTATLDWYGDGYPAQNPCQGTPAGMQVYFSTQVGPYDLNTSSSTTGQSTYWWRNLNNTINGNSSVSVTVYSSDVWSNGLGQRSDNPAYTQAFQSALANCKRIGVSFNGGCFFDWGIFSRGTGTITFHLTNWSVQ